MSAATSGGLFGGAPTGSSGGGLFGTSTGATTTSTGGGLFGGGAAGGPSSGGGGLFGGTGNPAPSGGGLFGGNPPSTGAGGGLFGSTAPTTTGGGGGLFGGTSGGGGGGLFGGGSTTTTGGGGLFGGGTTGGTSGGLFGASTGGTGGLFGGGTTAGQTGGGLFGSSTGTAQLGQVGQMQLNPFAHRDFFTGSSFYAASTAPGAPATISTQKSLIEKVGPFTITTLASNQIGKKLNSQTTQRKDKEEKTAADEDRKDKEAYQAELDKLRPIYYNQKIENLNFCSNPIYNKPVNTLPAEMQTAVTEINKKIAESSAKLERLKKATLDLKTALKNELPEKLDDKFTKLKSLNIKFKQIRQKIGMLNEFVTFFLSVGREFSLYYESLNIDKVYCLQIPSLTLDRIAAFIAAYVESLRQNIDEIIAAREKDPEFEGTNYIGEFGEIITHLFNYLMIVVRNSIEVRTVIDKLKSRFGIQTETYAREPVESMNEERLDAATSNIDVLTKLFV